MIFAKTSLGHVSSIYLEHVLWVPSLGSCSLLSWRAIVSLGKGFALVSSRRDMYVLRENKTEVIWESLTDKILLYKKRKSRLRNFLTNNGMRPLDILRLTISKPTTTLTLSTSPKFQMTGNARPASHLKALSGNLDQHLRLAVIPRSNSFTPTLAEDFQ